MPQLVHMYATLFATEHKKKKKLSESHSFGVSGILLLTADSVDFSD